MDPSPLVAGVLARLIWGLVYQLLTTPWLIQFSHFVGPLGVEDLITLMVTRSTPYCSMSTLSATTNAPSACYHTLALQGIF